MTNPRIGLLYRQTDAAMPLLDLAYAAEERRFDCIVIGEHTHIPVSRETPFPGTADGSLPDAYPEFPDPYVALAFIAARTSLRIAVGIALVAQHDPIALAKTVATLDTMSGGRLTLGVGFGWNREELANHGKSFLDRRAIVREHVELMRALWTQTEADPEGEAAAGHAVERGDGLGQGDGVVLGDERDADGDPLRGPRCDERERDVGVRELGIGVRQGAVSGARERGLAGDRDVGVLADDDAVKAAFLGGVREVEQRHGRIGLPVQETDPRIRHDTGSNSSVRSSSSRKKSAVA